MTVQDLIDELLKIENKNLPVYVDVPPTGGYTNISTLEISKQNVIILLD